MFKPLMSPCAPQQALQPGELAPGLLARLCPESGGALLDLQDYRRWAEQQDYSLGVPPLGALQDGQDVRSCPSCARLMQRLRSGTEQGFRIDRCPACQLVWLDRGEWDALAAEGQATQLLALLSDAGQRLVQQDEARERREAALGERLGEGTLIELQRIRTWLDGRSDRDELLNLLRNGW